MKVQRHLSVFRGEFMRINRVKLIAEMARQDLSVGDLAKNCILSRATITGVRSGKSCSRDTAAKLARGLGVPLESILERPAHKSPVGISDFLGK